MHILDMVEKGKLTLSLPDGQIFAFDYDAELHVDFLKETVSDVSKQPFDKQRLICLGRELETGLIGKLDVQPGDVINAIFK